MFTLVWKLVELAIDKFGDYKLKTADNQLERDKISADVEMSKDKWKAVILTSTGAWKFQLLFLIPLGLYWCSVLFYSMLWCKNCIFPQPWTIAALPSPFMEWAGAMIGFLFLSMAVKR